MRQSEQNMHGIWNGLGEAESAAMAASSGAYALYFARRVAAAVLAELFAGVALDAARHLGAGANEAIDTLRRAPLLIATLATNAVLAIEARR